MLILPCPICDGIIVPKEGLSLSYHSMCQCPSCGNKTSLSRLISASNNSNNSIEDFINNVSLYTKMIEGGEDVGEVINILSSQYGIPQVVVCDMLNVCLNNFHDDLSVPSQLFSVIKEKELSVQKIVDVLELNYKESGLAQEKIDVDLNSGMPSPLERAYIREIEQLKQENQNLVKRVDTYLKENNSLNSQLSACEDKITYLQTLLKN